MRYIGAVLWTAGQWVGVEVAEAAIPSEMRGLEWNDGTVAGVEYFHIAPPSPNPSTLGGGASVNGRLTPGGEAGSVAMGRGVSGGSVGSGGGGSSLRPPSRRARRSSSVEGGEGGVRKGLFVRPGQIVYVL